jgi:hypothetical protein
MHNLYLLEAQYSDAKTTAIQLILALLLSALSCPETNHPQHDTINVEEVSIVYPLVTVDEMYFYIQGTCYATWPGSAI